MTDPHVVTRRFERMVFKGVPENQYVQRIRHQIIPQGELIAVSYENPKTGEETVYRVEEIYQNLVSVLKKRINQLS